jgi:hypothetical protein
VAAADPPADPHAPGLHASQGIGLFSDTGAASCNITMTPFVFANVYVIQLNPQIDVTPSTGAPGTTGVEYLVTGMPGTLGVDWLANAIPGPGTPLTLGNPVALPGRNVAWSSPRTGTDGKLLIDTIQFLIVNTQLTIAPGTILKVVARTPPSNHSFDCPLFTDSLFQLHCVPGGEMRVNGGPDCTVAVENVTWSQIRHMYR